MQKKLSILFVIIFVLAALSYASQNEPINVLKNAVDRFVAIMEGETHLTSREEKRKEIQRMAYDLFDFTEISRRALGHNWKLFNYDEKKQFIIVFSKFLTNIYMDEIEGEYAGERVNYLQQDMLTKRKAFIKTVLIRKNENIPIDYSMLKKNETWQIYDIRVEGVSLISNYRSQFRRILLNKPPAKLIEAIRKKI
jgi:phospholipid transport system substrate-binding protein